MPAPLLYVDFNERLEDNLVLLSKEDSKPDANGSPVQLKEGLAINIYMDDLDEAGNRDDLIASGVVEANTSTEQWTKTTKWCCRIDKAGIRRQSDKI